MSSVNPSYDAVEQHREDQCSKNKSTDNNKKKRKVVDASFSNIFGRLWSFTVRHKRIIIPSVIIIGLGIGGIISYKKGFLVFEKHKRLSHTVGSAGISGDFKHIVDTCPDIETA